MILPPATTRRCEPCPAELSVPHAGSGGRREDHLPVQVEDQRVRCGKHLGFGVRHMEKSDVFSLSGRVA